MTANAVLTHGYTVPFLAKAGLLLIAALVVPVTVTLSRS